MDIKRRIQIELEQIAGSTASGADIHVLLTDALAEIVRLEHALGGSRLKIDERIERLKARVEKLGTIERLSRKLKAPPKRKR